jgi:hypothetical protein
MIIYKTPKEFKSAPKPVYDHIESWIKNWYSTHDLDETVSQYIDEGEKEDTFFEFTLGGYIYLAENREDLFQIQTNVISEDGERWLSLAETDAEFEICEVLDGWVALGNIENDSGGNTYYIPVTLQTECHNIQKSIERSI